MPLPPLNICIDMRPALSRPTGVGIYLLNLLNGLIELDTENQYHLFSSSWKERFRDIAAAPNFHIHDHRWPVRLLTFSWNRLSFPTIEFLLGRPVDIVHSPTPLVIPSRNARSVITVHDLHFFLHPEDASAEMRRDFPVLLRQHCKKSDAIIAVSEYTRQQLIQHLEVPSSKVYSIPHGVDRYFLDRVTDEEKQRVRSKFEIQYPYFLFVGTLEPRKNLSVLLNAFHGIPESQLVLAGPEGWGAENWRDLFTDRVIRTGYLSKGELRALYQGAVALVMPSIEEGFGLPLLEAMASGIPVVASRIPVFEQIGGSALLYFDKADVDELRSCLLQIQSDSELRRNNTEQGSEIARRFSWKTAARKTMEVYESLRT